MVMMDEIFGMKRFEGATNNRQEKGNFLNLISMTTNDPSGYKSTANNLFSTVNFLIVFAKNRGKFGFTKMFLEKEYDTQYSKYLLNPEGEYTEWRWESLPEQVATHLGYENASRAKKGVGEEEFKVKIAEFAIQYADRVFRLAVIQGGARAKRIETINLSKNNKDKVYVHPNEDLDRFYIVNGDQMVFYDKRIVEIDGQKLPGELLTDVWTDISWNGIAKEGVSS
jgi:adenine-specific DNA-methyltransferase